RQPSGQVGNTLHSRIEVAVPEAPPAELRSRPGIHMAEVALAEPVIEKDRLAPLGHRTLELEGQDQVLLSPERQLEGLQGVEFLVGGQTEIDAGDSVQGLGEVLNDRTGRE